MRWIDCQGGSLIFYDGVYLRMISMSPDPLLNSSTSVAGERGTVPGSMNSTFSGIEIWMTLFTMTIYVSELHYQ